ncbi:amidase family protein [Saccharomonospora sp. NPDC046836]|uniref:amidase n=1 Tax=Saccharomonospora sp. NPDC046836 TaxID=3156921 RepID=UPI0033CFE26A
MSVRRRLGLLLVAAALPAALLTAPAHAARPAPTAVDVVGLGVAEAHTLLTQRKVTSVQLVDSYLQRIEAYEDAYGDQPGVNAVITVNRHARAEAARLDAERRSGRTRGPLHGIPIVVKDNFDTVGMPTTSGSVALRDLYPRDDATQIRKLRDAGAIILAKTNLHEFAMNITTISSLGGQTRNPYDQQRIPGGSSGGTGAAVAASFAPAGMGSDTCGSIRIPAAHNNLVGLRPTLGLSSRDGVAPLASTQDTAGPLAGSVRDVALILDATVGYDPKDPVTAAAKGNIPRSYLTGMTNNSLQGKKVGVFTDYFGTTDAAQDTNELVRAAIDDMAALGAESVELGPQPEIMAAAAAANRVRDEFERDLNAYLDAARGKPRDLARLEPPYREITLADIATSGQVTPSVLTTLRNWVDSPTLPNPSYTEKLRQRDILQAKLTELMAEHDLDALVYPTISEPPAVIGTTQSYLNCRLAGYSGFPALSVPAGFTADGLPVGVELLGEPFAEPALLSMGYAYEQATEHRTPPESTPALR